MWQYFMEAALYSSEDFGNSPPWPWVTFRIACVGQICSVPLPAVSSERRRLYPGLLRRNRPTSSPSANSRIRTIRSAILISIPNTTVGLVNLFVPHGRVPSRTPHPVLAPELDHHAPSSSSKMIDPHLWRCLSRVSFGETGRGAEGFVREDGQLELYTGHGQFQKACGEGNTGVPVACGWASKGSILKMPGMIAATASGVADALLELCILVISEHE
ncbi:hypothetical protein B0H11DRAFT_1905072 [Mycena galericulata]|nr:hypothetical protein B0H11DRAFT_1905072 [Mycena galericulata]